MKKCFLSISAILLLTISSVAQKTTNYPVAVYFGSMCCGVPNNAPIMKLIKDFKKQYKIKQMTVDRIGPMGKEGEYYLAFKLKELSRVQKTKFIQQLKKITPTMKDRGSAELSENMVIDSADLGSRSSITTEKL